MRHHRLFAAITLALTAPGIAGQEPAGRQAPERQAAVEQGAPRSPFEVMSFNIRYGTARDGVNQWSNRRRLVVETIATFGPDLLGIQEALQFQVEFLRAELPGYDCHGVGRNDGQAGGEFVPVFYRRDRFRLSEAGHFWLSETPEIPGSRSWDSSLPRMVSWVRLQDLAAGNAPLVVMNTHFDHRGRRARLESARLLRARVDRFLAAGIPVVITGDFNTTEDDAPYSVLLGETDGGARLLDAFRVANPARSPSEATMSRWNGHRDGARIDWILHSPQFTTLHAIINHTNDEGRFPSDHYPVQAVLRRR